MASLCDQTPSSARDPASLFADADLDLQAEECTTRIMEKTALVSPTDDELDVLAERLEMRLQQGRGECIYELGVAEHSDDQGISEEELAESAKTLAKMAERTNCVNVELRKRTVPNSGVVADHLVRRKNDEQDFIEVRVAVVGNVDAGKSTLLGVLTHGVLDDGRGHARVKLFRHKHEIESGRTSSVGNDILGFDSSGKIVNNPDPHDGHLDWTKICSDAAKVITFIDLAGHEKYLKTTIFGMTGHLPHYCMLMVGSNAGVIGTTKEHLGLALALNVPVFVIITKVDMCPEPVLNETLHLLQKLLRSPGCRKLPVMVQSIDDVIVSAMNFMSERICPVFQVSNVTGQNLDLLRLFLNLLAVRSLPSEEGPAEFQIDDTYWVDGVGAVVSGTCLRGVIRLNDTLLLGPDALGAFTPVPIKSIHRKRLPVKELRGGQTASFALRKFKKKDIRKGMVLVSPQLNPRACWEFDGEILVLHHPTTISTKYQAMVHCGPIRQTATIVRMSQECLRTGDKAAVRFRFIKNAEYLRPNTRLVFREGRTKAVGNVTSLHYSTPAGQSVQQSKSAKRAANELKLGQHRQQAGGQSTSATATGASAAATTSASKRRTLNAKKRAAHKARVEAMKADDVSLSLGGNAVTEVDVSAADAASEATVAAGDKVVSDKNEDVQRIE